MFQIVRRVRPADFIDDPSFLGGTAYPEGWLLHHPESEWLSELASTYSRSFKYTLDQYLADPGHRGGAIAPAIQIDGEMGDGRGRACFHYALGIPTMPVAVFTTRRT